MRYSIAAAVLLSGCAGPGFVRQCNDLGEKSIQLVAVCQERKSELEFTKVMLDTCNAENRRLTQQAIPEVPK